MKKPGKRKPEAIAAAVLSGGRSSRMGRDKSLLRFKGKTLTALLVGKLFRAGFKPILVVGPRKSYFLPETASVIKERFRGSGPLSGVEAALRHTQSPCLVLPCDLPRMSVSALKKIRLQFRGRPMAIAGHPLPAIFVPSMLSRIQRCLSGKKLAVYPLMKNSAPLTGISKFALFNLNDQEDLKIVMTDKKVR